MPNGGNELQYNLTGDGIQITYSQFTGLEHSSQTFSYQGPDGNRSFTGNDIHLEQSLLGTLLTVKLGLIHTLEEIQLTLIVPHVDLGGISGGPMAGKLTTEPSQSVETLLIRRSTLYPQAASPEGVPTPSPIQRYYAYNLQGTAKLIVHQ